jgi:LacI family transcriptional regulator
VKDIAQLANVSIGTVDRVLHNRGRVAAETTERVWAAVKELNYSPNLVARNLSRARHNLFAVLMPEPDQDSGYWRLTMNGFESALAELAHHYVSLEYFHYDRFSPDSFRRAADHLLTVNPAGVLLAPTLFEESRRLITKLGDIPCVVFDGEVPHSNVLCTIGQDSYESGLLAGKLLHLCSPEGPYLTVLIGRADYHLRRRREGFERYFEGVDGDMLFHLELEHPLRDNEVLQSVSRLERKPTGVFVTNALGHVVARQLNERGKPHIPIIGYDLILENAACLRAGLMDFVINQEPRRQGYSSLYAVYRHAVLKEAVEPRIRMPIDLVMRENLAFHTNV